MTSHLSDREATSGVSRRTALRLAAAAGPALALGVGLPAVASAAPGRPSGAGYVRYEDLYRSGDSFQGVINKVTGNRVLTLPEGNFTWRDFTNGYYNGIRMGTDSSSGCLGLAGSGRGTVLRTVANTSTRDMGNNIAGYQIGISQKAGAVLTNFTLKGNPQNGRLSYGIMVAACPNAKISWLYLQGASKGTRSSPPGETHAINVWRSDGTVMSDCEVDGRDDSGNRIGSSLIGWNYNNNVKQYRTYIHHGIAGMQTFFHCNNVYTEDFKCYSTATGTSGLSGSGINHEQTGGTITHVRPTLIINGIYATTPDHTGNTGPHFSFAHVYQDVPDITITEPTWDKNVTSSGGLTVAIRDLYHVGTAYQKIRTAPNVVKNGVSLASAGSNTSGWGSKDPNRYYGWIH